MRVWVTRAEPEAQATAGRLRGLGHDPFVAPVLDIRPLNPHVSLAGVAAVAFTSRSGVRHCPMPEAMTGLQAFAVGDATARAARRAGFADVRSAGKDGPALAGLLAGALDPAAGAVLVVRAQEAAFDLEGALQAKGFETRTAMVYAAAPLLPAGEVTAALGAEPPLAAVLVHSPRAARQVARILDRNPAAGGLAAYAISPNAAAPLRALRLKSLDAAAFPNEAALLKLLPDPREAP
jgi:uroporphyrinogen-III synthase